MSFNDADALLDIQPTTKPLAVILPDGRQALSTHTALLNLPQLPLSARRVDVFPDFIGSLLSTGTLCDSGLTAVYTSSTVHFLNQSGTIVLMGTRSPSSRLWTVNIDPNTDMALDMSPSGAPNDPTTLSSSAVVTEATGTVQQIVDYYFATMGSCTPAALIAAIQDGYIKLPGLSVQMIRRHPPHSIAIAQGHLDQSPHGFRTTKLFDVPQLGDESQSDLRPSVTPRSSRYESVLTKVIYRSHPTDLRYTDLTGRFPVIAQSGASYDLVMLCGNYIHVETMSSRSQSDYVAAFRAGDNFFKSHGIFPVFERLDNEASALLIKFIGDEAKTTIQFLPPGSHRANKAERAIRTWKNHFIATLCTVDPSFPLDAWDKLVPQAELTVNLLRGSAFTPNTSAWQAVRGAYDFDHTPIAPPGMRILCFEPPDKRTTWAPHGVKGYYVGPALQHHRCFTVYIPTTASTRVTGQLSWHPPASYQLPGASPHDSVVSAIIQLRHALDHLRTHPAVDPNLRQPLQAATPAVTAALEALSSIFQNTPLSQSTHDTATLLDEDIPLTPQISAPFLAPAPPIQPLSPEQIIHDLTMAAVLI